MFSSKTAIVPTIEYLLAENKILREEIKVTREASAITAKLVVRQFEETERMLRKFQRANEERKAVLDAATQLSIIATELDGTITLFSPGATTLLGYSSEEMVGRQNIASLHLKEEIESHGKKLVSYANSSFNFNDNHSPASVNRNNKTPYFDPIFDPIKVFDQYIKQKISQSSDWTYIKKDGSTLPINLSITPFYNSRGSLRGYLFTAMDMSSHKLMEQELIEAIKHAEAANASKGDFLARMSHEIRTPMNGVLGMAHLLKKTELSIKQSNYLDKILGSANNLLNLINDILDFSKIDAGKLELESIPFNLEDVLSHLVNSIGINAEDKGLEFLFEIDNDVPFNLVGDPFRLGQILMNLASNAVKFTEHGEIVISVGVDNADKEYSDDSDYVTLKFSVKDSGIGLYPEQVDSLFEAFIQADDSITRKYGGTGLGLSICKQLTEMMGGEIWVQSTPNLGSNFIFTVRFKLSEDATIRSSGFKDSFNNVRALVVDDNETARNVLQSMLQSFKIGVDTACDGNDAIERLEQAVKNGRPYDIVLLDWIMPGIDGIETARRIRANAELAKTPAMLMVTANGREEARVEAEQAGLEGFLLKPVYASVMYNTLLEMLHIEHTPIWRKNRNNDNSNSVKAAKGLNGKHILLVEDNPINQEVATEFLCDAGVVVKIASNGLEAVDMVDKEQFDLVLMDIQMPVMDGLEAARKIRSEKFMTDIPIIAMTAHAMAGDREKSLNAGMNGHINKPVDPIELYDVMRKFIKDRSESTSVESNSYSTKKHNFSFDSTSDSNGLQFEKVSENDSNLIPSFLYIEGINHKAAIKRLNNKPVMFIKVLNDFKRSYADESKKIRDLFRAGDAKELLMRAHTLKGVAGYMGADNLFQSALKVEEFIRHNKEILIAETANIVETLAQSIEKVLEAISKVTLPSNSETLLYQSLQSQSDFKPSDKNIRTNSLNERNLKIDRTISFEMLNRFILLLRKGDATVSDMITDIGRILTEYGYSGELIKIMELIDDIEYEAAGDIVLNIMEKLNLDKTKQNSLKE